jgi:hypothetical protein
VLSFFQHLSLQLKVTAHFDALHNFRQTFSKTLEFGNIWAAAHIDSFYSRKFWFQIVFHQISSILRYSGSLSLSAAHLNPKF